MYLRRSLWSLAVLLIVVTPLSSYSQKTSRTPAKQQTPPAKPQPAPASQSQQPPAWQEWETLKPENEDFSILMPKNTTTEITKFPYHQMELNTRFYLSSPTSGPVVAVASMSGIKSNPAYSDLERFNSYVDAFKNFFPSKVRKDIPTKMILIATKPFHGYTGRVYKMTLGDLTGVVNAYVTRKRFYAIAVLNTKKVEALEEKFLSSFVIPDKPVETSTNVASNEGLQTQGGLQTEVPNNGQQQQRPRTPNIVGGTQPEGGGNTAHNPNVQVNNQEDNTEFGSASVQGNGQQNQTQQQQQQPKQRAPISGGVLNGKAIYLPLPELPVGERGGVVMVQVLIDETGGVIDAKAISGPQNLHWAAVNAARLARFNQTLLAGEPVKVSGTLTYNFVRPN